jgi:hypothetical protein
MGVLRPQRLLPNPQRPPVERLRLAVSALRHVKRCEIVLAPGHIWVFRAQHLLSDPQRPPQERLRLPVPSLCKVERGEIVQARRNIIFSWISSPRRKSGSASSYRPCAR